MIVNNMGGAYKFLDHQFLHRRKEDYKIDERGDRHNLYTMLDHNFGGWLTTNHEDLCETMSTNQPHDQEKTAHCASHDNQVFGSCSVSISKAPIA